MIQDTSEPRTLPPRGTALVLALCAALLLLRLGDLPLVGPDEPRYARVAIEMKRSGDLVTPTLQGRPWLEKPVLYYWLAAGAFAVLGENETAARLPSVASALLLVAATALLGARLYGGRTGLHAGLIAGTAALTFVYGHAASMDMLLAGTVTAGMGLLALRRLGFAGPPAAVAGAAMLGVATLAKGPLGVLLPVLVLVPHWLLARRACAFRLLSPAAVAAFALVALPWYALVYAAQGRAFIDTFLVFHNLARFTSEVHHHAQPFVFYLPVLLVGLFPWSGLLLPGLGRFERRSPADLLLAAWVLAPLVFFSAAGSKLPGYILPVLPPLAILMGRGAAALTDRLPLPRGRGPLATSVVCVVLGLLSAAAPGLARFDNGALRQLLMPSAAWGAIVMLFVARRIGPQPAEALRVLRVGAAGFLLLVTMTAPTLLAHTESGRDLFRPAQGREVLVWSTARTAWMAGYFYNDGRVREVDGLTAIFESARRDPVLVLCGPEERGRLESVSTVRVRVLATGPRRNALVRVERTD